MASLFKDQTATESPPIASKIMRAIYFTKHYIASMNAHRKTRLLEGLGQEVRRRREERGMTRQEVADASGLSLRFLGSLELGAGNISMIRLAEVAEVLEVPLSALFEFASEPDHREVIALLGLRGAGKSTLGPLLAKRLKVEWIELDERIEEEAGLSLAEIFALHGEAYYRRLERQTIEDLLETGKAAVIETGGGIVTAKETYELLRRRCTTVWLRALPSDHMARVQAQGDHRPMEGRPNAMRELEELLEARRPLYNQAEITLDTSRGTPSEAIDTLMKAIQKTR